MSILIALAGLRKTRRSARGDLPSASHMVAVRMPSISAGAASAISVGLFTGAVRMPLEALGPSGTNRMASDAISVSRLLRVILYVVAVVEERLMRMGWLAGTTSSMVERMTPDSLGAGSG